MMDYLINVVVAARAYWFFAVAIIVFYYIAKGKFEGNLDDKLKHFPKLALVIFVLGTVLGLTSPSNTYKLTTDYNKTQDLRSIERLDDSAAVNPPAIQDISRQPRTVEERAETAVDIRERAVTNITDQ